MDDAYLQYIVGALDLFQVGWLLKCQLVSVMIETQSRCAYLDG